MSPAATRSRVRRPIAGVAGFEYGNARLRARRSELLGDTDYHELFLAGTTERMLGVLRTTAYGPDVERALVQPDALRRLDGAIGGHLVRSLGDVRRFYSGRAAEGVELLLGRWDLRNLVAVVRSKARPAAADAELDSLLVPAGSLDAAGLAELAAQPSLRSTIELMVAWDLPSRPTARRLIREWPRFETTGDPSVFEDALTHAWFDAADRSLAAWSNTPLDSVLRTEVDQINLLASLRRRDGQAGRSGGDGVHLPGGSLSSRVLDRVEHAPTTADAFAVLAAQRLPDEWIAALRAWNEDHVLSVLGGRIEREIARTAIALFVQGDPLGIGIPIAFVWAKECEARNLRLLGRAVVHRLDWADVEPELFPW